MSWEYDCVKCSSNLRMADSIFYLFDELRPFDHWKSASCRFHEQVKSVTLLQLLLELCQGSYASGKCQGIFFFQGQGIVREFHIVSGKNEILSKCQGSVREFYISVMKWKKGRDFLFQNNDFKYKRQNIFCHFVNPHPWLNSLQYGMTSLHCKKDLLFGKIHEIQRGFQCLLF